MNDSIEIPLSKNKLFLIIAGAILFVVLGIWMFLNANSFQDISIRTLRNPIAVKIVGIIGILLFGTIGIYGFRKLFDKKVGLIIDSKGITDNTNASSVGLILWNDITQIRTLQVMSTKFLLIDVVNPEKYIEKAKSRVRAKIMRSNMKVYGTPLSITSNTLKYNFRKLEELVLSEFEKYKMKSRS